MRSIVAIATALIFTAAVSGAAVAATASAIHQHGQIHFDSGKGHGGKNGHGTKKN